MGKDAERFAENYKLALLGIHLTIERTTRFRIMIFMEGLPYEIPY